MKRYENHHVVVGDNDGVRHASVVTIVRGQRTEVTEFTVRTNCHPVGASQRLTAGEWTLTLLPSIQLGTIGAHQITLTTYRMREAVTCVRCLSVPAVFG